MYSYIKTIFLFCGLFFSTHLHAQAKKSTKQKSGAASAKTSKTIQPKPAAATSLLPDTITRKIKIITNLGEIVVRLSNKTPKHRDNFIKLVKEHFYDSLLFHRVINAFMIQGGDPKSKNAEPGALLGDGGVDYTIPAEFDSTLYHKRGALCAARTDNPEKASSGCQFYIVHGKTYSDSQLDNITTRDGIKFSPAQRMTYKMLGGTPQLDTRYTVFGEVESGIEVVEKIAQAAKDANNRPATDIMMRMEILE